MFSYVYPRGILLINSTQDMNNILSDMLIANPFLRELECEADVAKWNRLFLIAEKLFDTPYSKEAANWIARKMES